MSEVFKDIGPVRLVAGSIWFIMLMMLGGFFGWGSSILVSRFYGPVGNGILNTSLSIEYFAWIIVFGGLSQGLMKYGSEYAVKDRNKMQAYFASSIKYMSLLGVGVCVSLVCVAYFLTDLLSKIIVIAVGLSFLFSGMKDSIAGVIGAAQKNDYLSILNSSTLPIIFFASLIFGLVGISSDFLPLILIIASGGQLLVGMCLIRIYSEWPFNFRLVNILKHKASYEVFKEVYVFGSFISMGMIAFNVMKSLDIIILKIFLDYSGVGIYSVADFYSSILFYMTSLAIPLVPAISEANAIKETRLLEDYVNTALKYSIVIGLPLAIVIIELSELLVVGLYGEVFSAAIAPMRILTVGTFMLMLNYNLMSILIGLGRAKLAGMLMIVSALQYFVFLFLLVPQFKFIGGALSLTLTGFSSALLVPYQVKKVTKVNLHRGLWKVGLAVIPTTIFLLLAPRTDVTLVFVEAILGALMFLALLYKTDYISKNDLKMFRIAVGSFRIKRKGQK